MDTSVRKISLISVVFLFIMFKITVMVSGQESEFKTDEHTLLLCHFEKGADADYAKGEKKADVEGNIAIVPEGKFGDGVYIKDETAWLRYRANDGNLNLKQGTIEFWVKPAWTGFEEEPKFLIDLVNFDLGEKSPQLLRLYTDKGGIIIYQSVRIEEDKVVSENKITLSLEKDSFQNQWHHIAIMWENAGKKKGRMWFYFDEIQVGGVVTDAWLPENLPEYVDILSQHNRPISSGMVDELRISDVPRYKSMIFN